MKTRFSGARRLALAAITFSVATGCASGESIINAGNDATTTTRPAQPATGPGTTIALGGTIPLGATVPLAASTVPLVPTTLALVPSTISLMPTTIPLPTAGAAEGFAGAARPAAPVDIAPCPVGALDERDPADGPVEITFWHSMTAATEEALVALTDEYNAGQDRVHVTLQNQNGYNELVGKFFLSNVGDRPHVAQMPEFMTQQMADANAVIPVGACIQAEGFDIEPFLDRALLAYQTGGIQWSMPFNASTPVLYYNRAMFEAAGLDPDDPPVSLEEFRAYADAIVESGAAPVGIAFDHGVNSGGGWFLEQWLARLGLPYADNQNGRAGRATAVVFNTPEAVEMLEFVQAMVVDGVAVDVGDNPGATDVLFKLADTSEPAAMGITTSGGMGIVIDVLTSGQIPHLSVDDFGVGPLPGPSDTPGALIGGASLYITRDKGDAEAAAAWDFIKFLTTAETQSTWAAATGYVPIREDAADIDPLAQTYADDPRFRVAFDQLLAGSDDFSSVGPVLGPLQEVREVTARMMATIFAGGDVAQALADATDQANALIADYNARN